MSSYLIQYIDPKNNGGEEEPLYSEYTYGDKGKKGITLKSNVLIGDYLFFHTSIRKKLYITAFYEVEKVMDIQKAREDKVIIRKYRNPHLSRTKTQDNEVIVFGNPVKSMVLHTPLELNRALLGELSIPFTPSPNQTELAALTSKFRNWHELNDSQIKLLHQKVNYLYNERYLNMQKDLDLPIILDKTEKETIIKARIGQSMFKRRLLEIEKKCKLCGISDERFIIASHIKPWSQSNNLERLDINNGLLLCPNHDALFDKGYISFDEDGAILISESLDETTRVFLNINETMAINMNESQLEYMNWHRDNIYKVS